MPGIGVVHRTQLVTTYRSLSRTGTAVHVFLLYCCILFSSIETIFWKLVW